MSMLSREISKWTQTSPGPIFANTEAECWSLAQTKFAAARRWREPIDPTNFMRHLHNIGYRPEPRNRFDDGKMVGYWTIPLPSAHKGF